MSMNKFPNEEMKYRTEIVRHLILKITHYNKEYAHIAYVRRSSEKIYLKNLWSSVSRRKNDRRLISCWDEIHKAVETKGLEDELGFIVVT